MAVTEITEYELRSVALRRTVKMNCEWFREFGLSVRCALHSDTDDDADDYDRVISVRELPFASAYLITTRTNER